MSTDVLTWLENFPGRGGHQVMVLPLFAGQSVQLTYQDGLLAEAILTKGNIDVLTTVQFVQAVPQQTLRAMPGKLTIRGRVVRLRDSSVPVRSRLIGDTSRKRLRELTFVAESATYKKGNWLSKYQELTVLMHCGFTTGLVPHRLQPRYAATWDEVQAGAPYSDPLRYYPLRDGPQLQNFMCDHRTLKDKKLYRKLYEQWKTLPFLPRAILVVVESYELAEYKKAQGEKPFCTWEIGER